MSKKLLLTLAVLVVAAAAGIAAWALRSSERPEWTTSSPAALAELRLGLDAQRKYYRQEAQAHFEKALQLDPHFAMAARWLMSTEIPKERREALRAQLASTDRSKLTPREAFLVEHTVANTPQAKRETLDAIIDRYLREHPRDPYALALWADICWEGRRWDEAERGYQKLLAVDPNWVDAQNKMGYLSMAQGRFAEAEDRFRTYRFVAPDQANPHDSLGELLVLLGRFDEAQKELEAALAIRPDFCSSYVDLIEAARLSGHPERMPELIRELEKSRCGGEWVARTKCFDRMWRLYLARDWKALAAFFHDPCIQEGEAPALFPHLAAVLGGDLALARQIEAFAAKQGSSYMTREDPVVPHTAAIREVAEGKLPDALAHFARTDALIEYRGLPDGLFKLYNRLQWAHALELAGDHAGAERLLREVASVNQAMAARYVGLPTPQPPAGMATAGAPAPAANTPGAGAS